MQLRTSTTLTYLRALTSLLLLQAYASSLYAFAIGDSVLTTNTVNVRHAPTEGIAGDVIGTQTVVSQGLVLEGPRTAELNGTSYAWVYVDFISGVDGWVAEVNLIDLRSGDPERLGIRWLPSPHFSSRSQPVDTIVIHTTEGENLEGAIETMVSNGTSAHFVITPVGEIYQLVDIKNQAYHATYYNDWSIGIEMVGYSESASMWNADNLDALANLTTYLVKTESIKCEHPSGTATADGNWVYTSRGIVGHDQIQPLGNPLYDDKTDPGKYFLWDPFIQKVSNNILNQREPVNMPTISPNGGVFQGVVEVSLTCATDGATIYYTIDGTEPSETSYVYHSSLIIGKSTILKARAVKTGMHPSAVATMQFAVLAPRLLGTYLGTYGNQLNVSLALSLYSMEVDGTVYGHFYFFHNETTDGPTGRYLVKGKYEMSTHTLKLNGTQWIEQPVNFVFVGLDGTMSANYKTYSGHLAGSSSSPFFLQHISDTVSASPSTPAGTWVGYYNQLNGDLTRLLLIIDDNYPVAKAHFVFFSDNSRPYIQSGYYVSTVIYDEAAHRVFVKGSEWIKQPQGYSFIDLAGIFNPEAELITASNLFLVPLKTSMMTPGAKSSPGPIVSSTRPTFTWPSVQGAESYGLYIKEWSDAEPTVFQPFTDGPIIATTFTLPSGKLDLGKQYQWYVSSFVDGQESLVSSEKRYFQTSPLLPQPDFTLPCYRQDNAYWANGSAPAITFPPVPCNLGLANGNCTWYARGRMLQLGYDRNSVERLCGSAKDWLQHAKDNDVKTGSKPAVGAIAWWQPTEKNPQGHVAVVEGLDPDGKIMISESAFVGEHPSPESKWNMLYRTRFVSAPECSFIYVGPKHPFSCIAFPDFADTSGLTFSGAASTVVSGDGKVLRLVPALTYKTGSAFSSVVVNAAQFSTMFSFRFSKPGGLGGGADGLVFVAQSVSSSLGLTGGGLGYEGLPKSVGVEFDIYNNGLYRYRDPNACHIAIDSGGTFEAAPGEPFVRTVSPDFKLGDRWFAWIDYSGSILEVRLNRSGIRDQFPLLTRVINIPSLLGQNTAFVGFTAGTGSGYANHDILSWQYNTANLPIDGVRPEVNIEIPGTEKPILTIRGSLGSSYEILFTDDLRQPFVPIMTFVLQSSPYIWIDERSDLPLRGFYRVDAK